VLLILRQKWGIGATSWKNNRGYARNSGFIVIIPEKVANDGRKGNDRFTKAWKGLLNHGLRLITERLCGK